MAQVKKGDRVKVHYTGTLEDGSVFDTSEEYVDQCRDNTVGEKCGCGSNSGSGCGSNSGGPIEFIVGEGTLIPKFESAVIGLAPGQRVRVTIPADDAYGQRAEEMVAVIERGEIPAEIKPEAGQQMEVILQDGTPMPVLVTEVTDTAITLDANHPLAGCDLTFDILLVEIL
jgi:peptidylprolyl isomerase